MLQKLMVFWNACTLTLGKNIDSRNGSVTIEFDFKPSNNDEWVYLRLRSRADTLNNPETRAGIDKYDFLIIANTGGIGVAGGQSWNPGTVFVNQYSHVKIFAHLNVDTTESSFELINSRAREAGSSIPNTGFCWILASPIMNSCKILAVVN